VNNPYIILPFRFSRVSNQHVLVVNEVGEYHFLESDVFKRLIEYRLEPNSKEFLSLKGKHFLTNTSVTPIINLLATKYRTKKAFLRHFTSLHMVVVTLRCNQHCTYCHASSKPEDKHDWDMVSETAKNVVKSIMNTPSPIVKIEFQGGEPLLNYDIIKLIVKEAKKANNRKNKLLSFVICTNITLLDDFMLSFMKKENICISTSLDGPKTIHDRHRKLRSGAGSYDIFINNFLKAKQVLGQENVSVLMTVTKESLSMMKDIVDEYVGHNLRTIFMRPLNPYGYAKKAEYQEVLNYPIEDYIEAYKKAIFYIIDLNLKETFIEEFYTTLLLSRILTPFSTGFVDLQSPTGAGISAVIYDFNGDVYPADEGRMLARMGDRRFYMGNVNRDDYQTIFKSEVLRELINASVIETLPGCHSCTFQIFCGSDPIRNYAVQGNLIGHRPTCDFCTKNRETIKFLLELIYQGDSEIIDVFWSWITRRSISEVRGEAH
jgi:uncharacterized protein